MQQGVQQCWEFLANNVTSVYMLLIVFKKKTNKRRKMFFQSVTQVARKEKSEYPQSRVKPMTWLLFNQMLYH